MRNILAVIIVLSNITAAAADEKACILRAAQLLPRIAGLAIDESTTRPLPEKYLADFKGDKPIVVDIKITAAGQQETYSYLCLMAGSRPLVQRVIN